MKENSFADSSSPDASSFSFDDYVCDGISFQLFFHPTNAFSVAVNNFSLSHVMIFTHLNTDYETEIEIDM